MDDMTPEDADMSLAAIAAIEAFADQWAAAIELHSMVGHLVAPMRPQVAPERR